MFGWGKRQPDARPNAAAALHPAPTLTGDGRLEESPPLPIDGLGEDPLLGAVRRRRPIPARAAGFGGALPSTAGTFCPGARDFPRSVLKE